MPAAPDMPAVPSAVRRPWPAVVPLVLSTLALALAGCGGDGEDTPKDLRVNGVAATGAALGGAKVEIQCVGGKAEATAALNGSFDQTLPGARLPCVLRATRGTVTLHSVAETGQGNFATANITPLSELIVAQLTGAPAAGLYDKFDAAGQARLTHDGLLKAISAVGAVVKDAGVDLTNLDPIRSLLSAAYVNEKGDKQRGNDLDRKLDVLGAALKAAGTTVSELAAAIAVDPADPSMAKRLLKPAIATGCTALRGSSFRLLKANGATLQEATSFVTLDLRTLTLSDAAGTRTSLATTGQDCQFSLGDGLGSVLVDASGLAMWHHSTSGIALAVPEQQVALSRLEGEWNVMAYQGSGADLSPYYGTMTLNAAGRMTSESECFGDKRLLCSASRLSEPVVLEPDASGGFTSTGRLADAQRIRLFAFQAPDGSVSLLGIQADASGRPMGFLAATRVQALALPVVGAVERSWRLEVNHQREVMLTEPVHEVTTVDAVAQTFTQVRQGLGLAVHFANNVPRAGLRSGETDALISDSTVMPLPGTGLTFSAGSWRRDSERGSLFTTTVLKPVPIAAAPAGS